jgi:response regulator of citrate/malate metabolism
MSDKIIKILIVDDSLAVQAIVRRGILALGYDNIEIKKADNGLLALDIVRVWDPDIVLSDWHMPEMTGIELLKAINTEMLSIDFGLITTETSQVRIQEALDLGARFVVQKPFDFSRLHEAVIPLLQGSTDAKNALAKSQESEQSQEEETLENPIQFQLPTMKDLSDFGDKVSNRPLSYRELIGDEFKPAMPYLLGLYEDTSNNVVKAVALMDVNAACAFAACTGLFTDEEVLACKADKVLKKQFIANVEYMYSRISKQVIDLTTGNNLQLRSVNVIGSNTKGIDQLLGSRQKVSTKVEVNCPGIGTGQLAMISA